MQKPPASNTISAFGPVIVAFWGLETDYGAFTATILARLLRRSLAITAGRGFRAELVDALQLIRMVTSSRRR